MTIGYLIFCWRALPRSTSVFWLVFSLTHFYIPGMWCSTYCFASLFVRLPACSLLGWWVPMFPRRMSKLEVCMNCRFVSSSMFKCYPWRCRSSWRMLSILPWFFVESTCLGFLLWCCISIPGRRSSQPSRSKCCWYIYIGESFSIITNAFNLFILTLICTYISWFL